MGFWNLKTGVYDDDVDASDYLSITIDLDSVQATKYGSTKNVENLQKLLVSDLQIDESILSKVVITPDIPSDLVTISMSDLRRPFERLAFLQFIRLITKNESDDLASIEQGALATQVATDKLLFNATPLERTGNTIMKLVFDVIAGYPVSTTGKTIYEQMFKEWLAFKTDGALNIAAFGAGSDDWISGELDNDGAPTVWRVVFDQTAGSTAARMETVYQAIALCEGGIPNTYTELKAAGAVLSA